MRKLLIAANWKMYKTPAESVAFTRTFIPLAGRHPNTEVVLCPSPTSLAAVVETAAHNPNPCRRAGHALARAGRLYR